MPEKQTTKTAEAAARRFIDGCNKTEVTARFVNPPELETTIGDCTFRGGHRHLRDLRVVEL
jgi:hypothetical protein